MSRIGLAASLTGIDTNVIVRYMVRDDEAQHAAAAGLLESLSEENPGFVTSVTLAEVYWLLRRRYRLPVTDCLDAIRKLLEADALEFDDDEGAVRALELAENGADFADALIHSAFERFGVITTVTFDKTASRRLGWKLLP